MKTTRYFLSLCILFLGFSLTVSGEEFKEGRIKLVLHENTGRFSLYYLNDLRRERYEALFVEQDPRTSFITLMADDRTYRLGESTVFRPRIIGDGQRPAIHFESSFMTIIQEFSFIRSSDSALADGIRMDIRIVNNGERQLTAGVRFLLDTKLGESSAEHFSTDRRDIGAEILLSLEDPDRWWFSKNDETGLMGSISVPGVSRPDSIQIANWKRLNDVPWKIAHVNGRNFNLLPYSVGDSALCYYFDPVPIARGSERTVSLLLAAASERGFSSIESGREDDLSRILLESSQVQSSPELALRTDLITLGDLISRIDEALENESELTDEDLSAMEAALNRLKDRNDVR